MRKPWEQRDNETAKNYAAFRCYLSLEPQKRTHWEAFKLYTKQKDAELSKGYKSRQCAPDYFVQWAVQNEWDARAKEFDLYQQGEFTEEIAKQTRKQARVWAKRQEQVREEEWALREKLKAKIDRMLMFDVAQQRIEDEGRTIIIEPADFKFANLPSIIKTFVEVSRLAVDMPTSKREVTVKDVRDEVKKLSSQLGVDVDVDEAVALAMQLAESEQIH